MYMYHTHGRLKRLVSHVDVLCEDEAANCAVVCWAVGRVLWYIRSQELRVDGLLGGFCGTSVGKSLA